MKKLFIATMLVAGFSQTGFAQTVEVLTGTLNTTKNLDASICYQLDDCYQVLSGGVLNIPQGTTIRATSGASLIVKQGGKLNATGTSSSPVVFTSAQAVSSRTPGAWDGVYIAGNAVTNQSTPSINKSCSGTISYGGSDDADNSGTLQYVRIEYAGGAPSGDPEASALNLFAIGTGTTIDHIQVSYSQKNAFDVRGGKVDLDFLESLNNYKIDMQIGQGYTGDIQFLTGIRLDANAHDNTGVLSNGLFVYNDLSGSANTPVTHPVISNATFFGPKYCGASPISADFQAAVRLALNAQAEVYNSVFTGWNTGLQIVDNSTINNANVNGSILMSYNTFYANTTDYANSPANFDPTGTGCASTVTAWMDGSLACSQIDNFVRGSLTGYSNSVCGNYCTTAPTMILSDTNNVGLADSTWDAGGNFSHVTYRGSLTATNWSANWSDWCPQSTSYCSLSLLKAVPGSGLHFIPNPARSETTVGFQTQLTGKASLKVLDKITGKALLTAEYPIRQRGSQQMRINTSVLRAGTYFVQVRLSDGSVLSGPLVISE